MASEQERAEERKKQSEQMKLRTALNDAYSALESQKNLQSFSSFSFEEALDGQIERIAGASTKLRPNELDRVARVRNNLEEAIGVIRQIPPEAFLIAVRGRDVNT